MIVPLSKFYAAMVRSLMIFPLPRSFMLTGGKAS